MIGVFFSQNEQNNDTLLLVFLTSCLLIWNMLKFIQYCNYWISVMMHAANIKKAIEHYTLNANDTRAIIQPLHNMGIIGTAYMRIYPDGTIVNLASCPNWTEFYYQRLFENAYQEKDIADHLHISEGISLWALNPNNQVWQDVKNKFGYGNGVTIIEDHDRFREIMAFYSTEKNDEINHFYINKMDSLKQMKAFFVAEAHSLITQTEQKKNSFLHPLLLKKNDDSREKHHVIEEETVLKLKIRDKFKLNWDIIFNSSTDKIDKLLVKRSYFIQYSHYQIRLSRMEIKTLIELLKGRNSSEIGFSLKIKQTTVISYLENIKNKFGVTLKSELINIVITYQLIQQISLRVCK